MKYRCTHCDGSNVFSDAYVPMNDDGNQIRTLESNFFCDDCESDCRIYIDEEVANERT